MRLFIDACCRDKSRTRWLAEALIGSKMPEYTIRKLFETPIRGLDSARLAQRDALLEKGETNSEFFFLAREFALADEIVIAAPYWDLSLPARLKAYFEEICVLGITFRYTADGNPEGLCKAKKLTYITTAGGYILSDEYGYGYVRALCRTFYGIQETRLIKAEGLDLAGVNAEQILNEVLKKEKNASI